jgi:hypothetical protein
MAKSEGKITIEVQSKGRNAIAPIIYSVYKNRFVRPKKRKEKKDWGGPTATGDGGMAKRLDLLPQPVVEEEEEVDMEAEEMCNLASQRTQKALEWIVTERLAGRVTTGTTACCWAAVWQLPGRRRP